MQDFTKKINTYKIGISTLNHVQFLSTKNFEILTKLSTLKKTF